MTDSDRKTQLETLKKSIIKIHDSDGQPHGLGFLISSGYAVTCAHVVNSCNIEPGGLIQISFLTSGEKGPAWVAPEYWKTKDQDDIAILRLHPYWTELPRGVKPASMGSAFACDQDEIQYLGLPPSGLQNYTEIWTTGRIVEIARTEHKSPMLQIHTADMNKGMSGAPILDINSGLVVGMISEYLPGPTYTYKFATTSDAIHAAFSRFDLLMPDLISAYLEKVRQDCSALPQALTSARSENLMNVFVMPEGHSIDPDSSRQQVNDNQQPQEESDRQPQPVDSLVFSDDRPVIILGDPGQGKSSFLRMVAACAWQNPGQVGLKEHRLPMYLPLGKFPQSGTIEERFKQVIGDRLALRSELPENFLVKWPIQTGAKWLILLDGLDDIPERSRSEFFDWLNKAVGNVPPGSKVILTTRNSIDFEGLKPDLYRFIELDRFNLSQQVDLSLIWLGLEKAVGFLAAVSKVELENLYDVPWFITLALVGYLNQGAIPTNRVDLESQFIERILEPKVKLFRETFGDRVGFLVRPCMEHLALAMLQSAETPDVEFLVDQTRIFFQDQLGLSRVEALETSRRFVDLTLSQSGLMISTRNTFSFVHATIQYHLAASAIMQNTQEPEELWKRIQPHLPDSRLGEYFSAAILACHNPEILVDRLLALYQKKQDDIQTLFVAANALAGMGAGAGEKISARVLALLIQQIQARGWRWPWMMNNEDGARIYAGDVWPVVTRFRASAHYKNAMQAMLDNSNVTNLDHVLAARELGEAGILVQLLTTCRLDPSAAQTALDGLGRMHKGKELLSIAKNNSVLMNLRVDAILVLCNQTLRFDRDLVDRAGELLVELANENRHQEDAIEALYQLNRPDLITEHIRQTGKTKGGADWLFHNRPLAVLGAMNERSALRSICEEAGLDLTLRAYSAYMLGLLGERDQAVRLLCNFLKSDGISFHEHERVIRLLGELNGAEELGEVLLEKGARWEYLEFEEGQARDRYFRFEDMKPVFDPKRAVLDEIARLKALELLSRLGGTDSLDPYWRLKALRRLAELGEGKPAASGLLEIVRAGSLPHHYRNLAAVELESMRQIDEAQRAYAFLSGDVRLNPEARGLALQKLFELKYPAVEETCLSLLGDPAHAGMMPGILTLMRIHEQPQALSGFLGDSGVAPLIRFQVAQQLLQLDPKEPGAAAALQALGFETGLDPSTRLELARQLIRLGATQPAQEILLSILGVEDQKQKLEIFKLLGELGAPQAQELESFSEVQSLDRNGQMELAGLLAAAGRREAAIRILEPLAGPSELSLTDRAPALVSLLNLVDHVQAGEMLAGLQRETEDPSLQLWIARLAVDLGFRELAGGMLEKLVTPAGSKSLQIEIAATFQAGGFSSRADSLLAPMLKNPQVLTDDEFEWLILVLENMKSIDRAISCLKNRIQSQKEVPYFLCYDLNRLGQAEWLVQFLNKRSECLTIEVFSLLHESLPTLSVRAREKYAGLLMNALSKAVQENGSGPGYHEILFTLCIMNQLKRIKGIILDKKMAPEIAYTSFLYFQASTEHEGVARLCLDILTDAACNPANKMSAGEALKTLIENMNPEAWMDGFGLKLMATIRSTPTYTYGVPHIEPYWKDVVKALTGICLKLAPAWKTDLEKYLLRIVEIPSITNVFLTRSDHNLTASLEEYWKGTNREQIMKLQHQLDSVKFQNMEFNEPPVSTGKKTAIRQLCRLRCFEQLAELAFIEHANLFDGLAIATILWEEKQDPVAERICRHILDTAENEAIQKAAARALNYRGYQKVVLP